VKASLISIADPAPAAAPGTPLLRLGFRPFYLLAAAFAAIAIPLWLLQWSGQLAPHASMPALLWHAHEMIFGFAAAVITGFLFTAVRNWTGQPTPQGAALAGFSLLWLAGRVAPWLLAANWAALIDLSFLPAVALALALPLWRSGNRRNYFVPLLLLGLAAINAWFYRAASLGDPLKPLTAALGLITVLETVIAGRVVPMFTRNAVAGVRQFRLEWLERVIAPLTAIAFVAIIALPQHALTAVLAATAALLHGLRLWGWGALATRHKPMLWVLHLAYCWLVAGFAGAALAALGLLPWLAVLHMFGVGAMGGLMTGMMTRTALGHTGRMLTVGRLEIIAYACLPIAALLRVLPLLLPVLAAHYQVWMFASATCWSTAFIAYLIKYTPWLTQPRIDNKPG
jgi:uncharacterized protein involved in response to NO